MWRAVRGRQCGRPRCRAMRSPRGTMLDRAARPRRLAVRNRGYGYLATPGSSVTRSVANSPTNPTVVQSRTFTTCCASQDERLRTRHRLPHRTRPAAKPLQELDRATRQEVEDQHLAVGDGRNVLAAFAIHDPTFWLTIEARSALGRKAQINLTIRVTVTRSRTVHEDAVDAEATEVFGDTTEANSAGFLW